MTHPSARESIKSTPRPRDRKTQIVGAARSLFADRGFAAVSAEEIAAQVGITAGALYRHFDGKQDLLVHGLIDALGAAGAKISVQGDATLEDLVATLLRVAAANRELGALWGREVRFLDAEHQAIVRQHFFETFGTVRDRLATLRPDLSADGVELMTWSLLASLTSVAYHREALSTRVTSRLHHATVQMCRTALDASPRDAVERRAGVVPSSRREAILSAATALFHQKGFLGTSIADLGDGIGLTGAAVYRYFPTKSAVLEALVTRTLGALQVGLSNALAEALDEAHALTAALDAYIGFAAQSPRLVHTLLWEVGNLPEPEARMARRAQREFIDEWESLLRAVRPDLNSHESRALVAATLAVINDAVRTSSLQRSGSLQPNLQRLGRALLLNEHDVQRS